MQIIMIYSGMKGYLDKLSLLQVIQFKFFLVNYMYDTNVLKGFVITNKINHVVINTFLKSAISTFLTN